MEQTNQLAAIDNSSPLALSNQNPFEVGQGSFFFSTIETVDDKGKQVQVYNAINAPDHQLSDCIGEVIDVTDFIVQGVTIEDEKTGAPIDTFRTILISTNGKSYAAVSQGIIGALRNIMNFCGTPSHKNVLRVVPVKRKTRKKFEVLTLELATQE